MGNPVSRSVLFLSFRWASPVRCPANEFALGRFQSNAGLIKVIERETALAATADSSAAIFLRVVAGMALALALHPLSDLQLVCKLQHVSSFGRRGHCRP